MSGSVCTSPSSVIVRQKYSDNISRLSGSIRVLYINCIDTVVLRSVLRPQRRMNSVLTSATCSFVSLILEIPSSASTAIERSFSRGGAGSSLNFAKLLNCLSPSW